MDINAKPGTKVKFVEKPTTAYGVNLADVNLLVPGNIYTIDHTEIHSFHTKVYLIEIPKVPFNSVWFDGVE